MNDVRSRLAEAVQRGADLLWSKGFNPWEIDLDRLDVANPCQCVLGQLIGRYHTAIRLLFPAESKGRTLADLMPLAEAHGFEVPEDADYDELNQAWRELPSIGRP